ncbi:UNVERIFIED_CONTAM: hypothetical protein RKD50_003767 [Streptomyces canus]
MVAPPPPKPTSTLRQSFLRRFDLEHTFRLFKQTLGWTRPRLRSSEAADRWTWLARRAQRDGSLRADLNGQDVMLLICGVYYTAAPLLAADPSAWRRYLRLTFDGMCATGTGPLPPALFHDSLLPTIR